MEAPRDSETASPLLPSPAIPRSSNSYGSVVWAMLTKDPSNTLHSFKMALALSLVLLLVLLKAPYSLFGTHAIWAIMTVIVVFEVTIGILIAPCIYVKTYASSDSIR
jgi:hypothetical protein